MSVLAYITDLSLKAQVSQIAKAADVEVNVVSSLYHLLPGLEESPSMVMIDLEAKGISAIALIVQVREKNPNIPIVVCGSSNQKEVFKQVRTAGVKSVLPREKLSEELGAIFAQYRGNK